MIIACSLYLNSTLLLYDSLLLLVPGLKRLVGNA